MAKQMMLFSFAMLLVCSMAYAVPYALNQQGVLRNSSDFSLLNGTRQFNFSVFNSSNGVVYSSVQQYDLSNGIYNLVWQGLDPSLFMGTNAYFRLGVGNITFGNVQFASVPYSFVSELARNVSCADVHGAVSDLCTLTAGVGSGGVQNNTDVVLRQVNASRFNGLIDCSNIDGGSDGNFCVDSTGGGSDFNDNGITQNITRHEGLIQSLNSTQQRTYDYVICPKDGNYSGCTMTCQDNDCSNEINAILEPNKHFHFKAGFFKLDNLTTSRINICSMNNTIFSGEGIDRTIIFGNGFTASCAKNTNNIIIRDMTINLNESNNNALGFAATGNQIEDITIDHVKALNSSSTFLMQLKICGGSITNSYFQDAGLNVGVDDITIANYCKNKYTYFTGNTVVKTLASKGGGLLTNGGSFNLIITNNFFYDENASYAAISMEGQTFDIENIIISNNLINHSDHNGGIIIGLTANKITKNIRITDNTLIGGTITYDGNLAGSNSLIANNMLVDSNGGITVSNCKNNCKVSNNQIINFNYFNHSGVGASTRPAIRIDNSNFTQVDNNLINKEQTGIGTDYGVRLINTFNTSVTNNEFRGINKTNIYTFSNAAQYYIDTYEYTTDVPSCFDNSIVDDKTIINSTGLTYALSTCVDGVWRSLNFNQSVGSSGSGQSVFDVVVCQSGQGYDTNGCDVVCDTSDCSSSIAEILENNTNIYFNDGNYLWSTNKTVTGVENLSIIGGADVLLNFNSAHLKMVNFKNTEVKRLSFSGSTTADADNSGFFRFFNSEQIIIDQIKTRNIPVDSRVIYLSNVTYARLSNLNFFTNSSVCQIDASGRDWEITGSTFNNIGTGCDVAFGSLCQARFTNNIFSSNGSAYAGLSLEEFANFCDPKTMYKDILIQNNQFFGKVGVLTVDRGLGYYFKNIKIDNNIFNLSGTAVSMKDSYDTVTISNNIIVSNGDFHIINFNADSRDDINTSNLMISNNFINSIAGTNSGILLANATNTTISGNKIFGYDCIRSLGSVNGLTMTDNKLECRSAAFRLNNATKIYEDNNVVIAPTKYSLNNLQFPYYLKDRVYGPGLSSLTCANGTFVDGKSLINSTNGQYSLSTCINGDWKSIPYNGSNSGDVNGAYLPTAGGTVTGNVVMENPAKFSFGSKWDVYLDGGDLVLQAKE